MHSQASWQPWTPSFQATSSLVSLPCFPPLSPLCLHQLNGRSVFSLRAAPSLSSMPHLHPFWHLPAPGQSGVWACLLPATLSLSVLIILPGFTHLHAVSGVLFLQTLDSYPSLERGRDFVPCELTDSSVTSACDAPCGMSSWVAIVVNPGAGNIRSPR